MPWCPKCKNEYREGITFCSDCNAELVDDLNEAFSDSRVLVFTTEHREKTDDFIKYLAYSGIHSYSVEPDENDFIWSLYVAEEDYKKASKLFTGFALTENERAIEKQLDSPDSDIPDMPDGITEPEEDPSADSDDLYPAETDTGENAVDVSYSEKQEEEIRRLNARIEFDEMQEAPSTTYIRKSDRAREYRFSSYTCLICGAAGIIFIILNMLGIINVKTSVLSQYVLLFVFAAFFFGGIILYFNSKTIQSEAGDEEDLENSVVEWLNNNVTESYLSDIHDDDTPEEVNYFKYCEVIKESLSTEFPEATSTMLDALIDEHLSKIC